MRGQKKKVNDFALAFELQYTTIISAFDFRVLLLLSVVHNIIYAIFSYIYIYIYSHQ